MFGRPKDACGNTGLGVIVDRLSIMVRCVAVRASVSTELTAMLFINNVFLHHGLLETFLSDRDPRFAASF